MNTEEQYAHAWERMVLIIAERRPSIHAALEGATARVLKSPANQLMYSIVPRDHSALMAHLILLRCELAEAFDELGYDKPSPVTHPTWPEIHIEKPAEPSPMPRRRETELPAPPTPTTPAEALETKKVTPEQMVSAITSTRLTAVRNRAWELTKSVDFKPTIASFERSAREFAAGKRKDLGREDLEIVLSELFAAGITLID